MWPENWPAWQLFQQLAGQWRAGVGGVYALDYTALFMRMERMRLADDAWDALFQDVRVLEGAALEQIRLRKKA